MKSSIRECNNKRCKYISFFMDAPKKVKCKICKNGNMIIKMEEKKR